MRGRFGFAGAHALPKALAFGSFLSSVPFRSVPLRPAEEAISGSMIDTVTDCAVGSEVVAFCDPSFDLSFLAAFAFLAFSMRVL